jgi:hypothetical protein
VCAFEVPAPALDAHANERWWKHAWHKVKSALTTSYVSLTGTIRLLDTTNIKVLNLNGNDVEFQFRCPIDCGEDPIKTNSTCTCKDGVQTDGACTCETGVSTPATCTCETGVNTPQVETPTGDPLQVPDGIETPTITGPLGGAVEAPGGVVTPTITSPSGLPVDFPDGGTFPPPTTVTLTFDPNHPSITSITTTTTTTGSSSTLSSFSSSSSPSPSSGSPSGGLPGGGCSPSTLLLREPLIAYDPVTKRKVKLIGSVVHAATSAASSAASSATSAATSAASAATQVVSSLAGLICNGPGVPDPTLGAGIGSLSGIPVPQGPSGPNRLPGSLSGSVSAAAFAGSSPSPPSPSTSVPGSSTSDAAAAAVLAAVTGAPLPRASPVTITLMKGGLQVPSFLPNTTIPLCDNAVYRGKFAILAGNDTTDDRPLMCLNEPSKDGWGWYEVPTSERLMTDIFNGNGSSGLVCDTSFCNIYGFPNGSLYQIRPAQIVTGGLCSFCNLNISEDGRVLSYSNGDITIYNRSASYDQVITYYTDSMTVYDANSTIINAGSTVLNQTLIQDLNVTNEASAAQYFYNALDYATALYSGTISTTSTYIGNLTQQAGAIQVLLNHTVPSNTFLQVEMLLSGNALVPDRLTRASVPVFVQVNSRLGLGGVDGPILVTDAYIAGLSSPSYLRILMTYTGSSTITTGFLDLSYQILSSKA